MFEVITQSQPQDYQSLEILKEAYAKLGRDADVIRTAKKIAQVYVSLGQLSSAILEYESILQRYPDDADVRAALQEIESKAGSLGSQTASDTNEFTKPRIQPLKPKTSGARTITGEIDDGRQEMQKIFVESKLITAAHFEDCWPKSDLSSTLSGPVEPFIQVLANNSLVTIEKSLRVLSDRSRTAFLPLDRYDVDHELARSFALDTCLRWCVLPFDQMSKSILVATCNPYNRQAAAEISEVTKHRLLWYLTTPQELMKNLRRLRH